MLVITRKKMESLMIGDAKVIVKDIGANRIVLVIDAPKDVRIVRDDAKNKEAKDAADPT